MKIALSLLFLLLFGVFVLLATVDLEPYFTSKNDSAPRPPTPRTNAGAVLSHQNGDTPTPRDDSPTKITTHQLIITDGSSKEAGKTEQTAGLETTATPPQETTLPIDNTVTSPAHGDRP